MIKTKAIIEHKIGDRVHEFQCDPNSPLGEIFDALTMMRSLILNRMVEEQKKSEPAPEEPKEV